MAAVQLYNMSLPRTVPCNINIGHSKWLLYNMSLPWTLLYFHVELNKQYSPLLPGLCPAFSSPGTTDYSCTAVVTYHVLSSPCRQNRWLLYSTIWYYRNSYSEVSSLFQALQMAAHPFVYVISIPVSPRHSNDDCCTICNFLDFYLVSTRLNR